MDNFYEEIYIVSTNMKLYGGSFMKSLADALAHADIINAQKIRIMWPEEWNEYLNWGKPQNTGNN